MNPRNFQPDTLHRVGFLLSVLVLCNVLALAGCDSRDHGTSSGSTQAPPPATQSTGVPVPAASEPVVIVGTQPATRPTTGPALPVVDLDGIKKLIAESGSRGQITVIDFWATWCGPCVEIFPGLHEGLLKLGPKVRPVTVTLDAEDSVGNAVKFLEEHHAVRDAYMLVPDTDKQLAVVAGLGKKWDNLVVPAVLVFDERGALIAEFTLTVKTEEVVKKVGEFVNR